MHLLPYIALLISTTSALAFPGAEGFGKDGADLFELCACAVDLDEARAGFVGD